MDLGDYLAFVKNDKIIDSNTNRGSYVSVKWVEIRGAYNNSSSIIFTLL